MPDNPGDVYADSGYRGQVFASAVLAKAGAPKVVQTGAWGRPGDDTLGALRSWNYSVQRVRCRIPHPEYATLDQYDIDVRSYQGGDLAVAIDGTRRRSATGSPHP